MESSPLTPDVAIIGAGTAGLYALREVRRARKSFVLIDHGPLGTTCARVGCMPSKVALHAGAQWASAQGIARIGGQGAAQLRIDLAETWAALRQQRDAFSGNAARKALEAAGDRFLDGTARFVAPGLLQVAHDRTGTNTLVRPGAVVIANGSRPVLPDWLAPVRDRAVTTDELFELPTLPARIGVLGLGAIGLEMGLALSRLGVQVTGADLAPNVAGITDPALADLAVQRFGREMVLWLGEATRVERTAQGVALVSGSRRAEVDLLLVALGRRPNTDSLDLAAAGLPVSERGLPVFNRHTMQVGTAPVFIAGDANGDRPLMHEAVDEGAIAGYNAAAAASAHGQSAPAQAFQRKVPLGIAFTDPDVVSVGARFDELNPELVRIGVGTGAGNGRARVLHEPDSLLRVYADASTGRLLGGAMVGARAEHLAHLLAWAIQRGETAHRLLELPFYHPVVEEMLHTALQDIARHTQPDKTLPLGLRRL